MAILRDPFSTVQIPKPLVELSASLCNDIDDFFGTFKTRCKEKEHQPRVSSFTNNKKCPSETRKTGFFPSRKEEPLKTSLVLGMEPRVRNFKNQQTTP